MTAQTREKEALKEIVRRFSIIAGWPDHHLPCDYLVLDVETTGFSSNTNRVVSVGFCAVQDCEISHAIHSADYANVILKWPEEVFVGCEKATDIHGIDYAVSQAQGIAPAEAMRIVSDAIDWAKSNDMRIAGHNLVKFDAPFLEAEMARAGITQKFDINNAIDTHVLCKAMQLGVLPGNDESIFDYFFRVLNLRAKGVYSNLDHYCMERFKLAAKYQANAVDAHNSGYDCWLVYLVVQELNKMLGYSGYEEGEIPW